MHIPTHILSGWCVGNVVPGLGRRERVFCMIAATAPDLDGIGLVWSWDAYWDYHHKLGHNVFAALLFAAVLTVFAQRKSTAFLTYLALAHLHLVLDYFGSGPGWAIYYGWPLSQRGWMNPHAWPFTSWQNFATFGAFLVWTVWIAVRHRRTPIESLAPRLDRAIVALLPPARRLKDAAPLSINPS